MAAWPVDERSVNLVKKLFALLLIVVALGIMGGTASAFNGTIWPKAYYGR